MAKQEVARLYVSITADDKAFNQSLERAKKGLENFSNSLKNIGNFMTRYITVPIAGISVAAYKMIETIDAGFSEVIKATGATGAAAKQLKKEYMSVLKSVEYSAADVGKVIGALHSRLGLTGKALRENSVLLLKFAEITGTDAAEAVRLITRIMGDWQIKTSKLPSVLDKLAKISQLTGISISQLGEKVVFYGVQLRYLGFSFDEAIALLGKWEKEGVATEKILGILSRALGNLAKKTKDPIKAFWDLAARVRNAKSENQALSIAVQALGTRAGADFAKAVREGRFAIDEYTRALKNARGTVVATERDSSTLSDTIAEFKNRLQVELYPALSVVVREMIKLLPAIRGVINALSGLLQAFTRLSPETQSAIIKFLALTAVLGPVLRVLSVVISGFKTAVGVIISVRYALLRLMPAFSPLTAALALLATYLGSVLVSRFNLFKKTASSTFAAFVMSIKSMVNDAILVLNRLISVWNRTIGKILRVKFGKIPFIPLGIKGKSKKIGGPTPFASGGIVKKATLALIGEKEPEVVIPLSRLDKLIGAYGNKPASVQVEIKPSAGAERFVDFVVRKNISRWR